MSFKPRRFRQFRAPVQAAPEPTALEVANDRGRSADRLDADGAATLLELARERWRLGDWDALVSIPAAALERSPDPGRLALMVASAHLQLGRREQAGQFLQRATDWGVDRRLVAHTLIAGLHDTLGRAASLQGDDARAQTHFTAALALAAPARVSVTAARARASVQMKALAALAATPPADRHISEDATAAPLSAPRWTIDGPPRRLGPGRPLHPWASAQPTPNGGWLIAWTAAHPAVVLQALDADTRVTAERELPLVDGATDTVSPGLCQDAQGHWLLSWLDTSGQPRWRRSAEPADPRPWSGVRRLDCPWPAANLDVMSANASFSPALALATGPGRHFATWHFDERRCEWRALDRPSGWPDTAMAMTLHTDTRRSPRLLGWMLDASGHATELWSSTYDTELARWREAQRLAMTIPSALLPVGQSAAAPLAGTWVRATSPSDHLLFRDGQSQWWRLRPDGPTAQPFPAPAAWRGNPVPISDEAWLVALHDGRCLLTGHGAGDDGFPLAHNLGSPLALATTTSSDAKAILLSQADDGTGELLLTRLTC